MSLILVLALIMTITTGLIGYATADEYIFPVFPVDRIMLRPGEVYTLNITLSPETAPEQTVKWEIKPDDAYAGLPIVGVYADENCTKAVGINFKIPGTVFIKAISEGKATVEAIITAQKPDGCAKSLSVRVLDYTPIPKNRSDAGEGLKYYVGFNEVRGTFSSGSEIYPNLINGYDSKYCINIDSDGIFVEFNANKPFVPRKYYLRTAADTATYPGRNPKSWKILAKLNESDEWTTIAAVSGDTKMEDRDLRAYSFPFSNDSNKTYQYFRFEVSSVAEGDLFQLSELYMAGSEIYNLRYDANGGTGSMDGSQVLEGQTMTIPACGFTAPKDKIFDYWTVSGSETHYAENEEIQLLCDYAENDTITITANWCERTEAKVTKEPKTREVTYTGKAQALIATAGEAEGGTLLYALGEDQKSAPKKGWTKNPEEITAVDAGTYYVWYYAQCDARHLDSKAACVKGTVNKAAAAITVAPTANAELYNGSPQELATAGEAKGGTVQYTVGEDNKTAPGTGWSQAIPTRTEAGIYYVWYKAVGDANHTDTEPVCIKAKILAIPTQPDPTQPEPVAPEPEKTDLSGAEFSPLADHTYNGKVHQPKMIVKVKGRILTPNMDYTVQYINNRRIGTATITITGMGDYSGTASTHFLIVPRGVSLSEPESGKGTLTLKWKPGSNIDGYEIEYGLKKDFKGAKKIKLKGAKNDEYEITKLRAKKTYYVRIRTWKKVKGKTYYSEWSKKISKKVK